MAIDYISTTPWNDPYNPWPAYAQVVLSAVDIPVNTVTMDYFYPFKVNNPGETSVHYVSEDGFLELYYTNYADSIVWEVNYDGGTAIYNQYLASGLVLPRAVPTKTVGSAGNWIANGAADVNSLYIQPVTTVLTPWEKRRIAGGTG